MGQDSGYRLDWVLCLVSLLKLKIKVLAGLCCHLELRVYLQAHPGCLPNRAPMAVAMRFLSSCWMSVRDLSELLQAVFRS